MVMNSVLEDSAAFDALAEEYDATFTNSPLGRLLRRRVWQILAANITEGQHFLELACGTGEDAIWLARRNVRVTAIDGSQSMVCIARAKVAQARLQKMISFRHCSLQMIAGGQHPDVALELEEVKFDGAFCNFGGLNTISDWKPLARALAKLIKPGGRIILVPMGPYCPWEVCWYVTHGQPRKAFRRFHSPAMAKLHEKSFPVWYPSAKRLRKDFSREFRYLKTESIGLWLPPSYLKKLPEMWPNLFAKVGYLEAKTARLTGGWGDHYAIVFERIEVS
jgi:ubiquinone/menaquinone biosynthesis C-methylase UbiE